MEHYAGIVVSLKLSSLCVIDAAGNVASETVVANEPTAIVSFIMGLGVAVERVGLRAGPFAQALRAGLEQAGFVTHLLETSHVKGRLTTPTSTTDYMDAHTIAQLVRVGRYRSIPFALKDSSELAKANVRYARNMGITQLKSMIAVLEQAVQQRDGVLNSIARTRSWRVTAPLRSFMRMLSKTYCFLLFGRRPSPLFDRAWYLEQYPDVGVSEMDPYYHFLRYGASEGRDPNSMFDTDWYLQQNPDVKASGVNPLEHYSRWGYAEGRDPHPLFATHWYLQQQPEQDHEKVNPLLHYLRSLTSEVAVKSRSQ